MLERAGSDLCSWQKLQKKSRKKTGISYANDQCQCIDFERHYIDQISYKVTILVSSIRFCLVRSSMVFLAIEENTFFFRSLDN